MAKRSIVRCPSCSHFADDKRGGKMTSFVVAGVTHVAPDMWLAGRSQRTLDTAAALMSWAEQCELHQRFEAQRG